MSTAATILLMVSSAGAPCAQAAIVRAVIERGVSPTAESEPTR